MLPIGTVTFLFTDIQGSTPLWEREPRLMAQALQIHHSALRQAVEANGGAVFKIIGDAFQAAFSTASQALGAAIAGQQLLQSAPWNELGALAVRMGMHSGEAELEPDGVDFASSHTLNRVARISSAAHGGQILLSYSTAELLRGHLPADVILKDLGEHRLKGMLHLEHIFQVMAPGLPEDISVLDAPPGPQKSLLKEVIARAQVELPGVDVDFLDGAIFSRSLTTREGQDYLRLLTFARSLQDDNPLYEPVYHHMLYLYVLNGSRQGALKSIDRRLRGLEEGQGAFLLVSGASGSGKTSLVIAFQERLSQFGSLLVPARCYEQERTDYAIWKSVARTIASLVGTPIETMLAPIGTGKEAGSSQQLQTAFGDWLNKCSTSQKLVILLDDLQWADVDSLEVLNHLAGQPNLAPILFIATYRSEETENSQPINAYLPQLQRNLAVELIHLDALSREDIERLVTAYHGACSPGFARYLSERADGNPLFTIELLNDLIAQDLLQRDQDGRWLPPEKLAPVPPILRQLITQRLSRLDAQVGRLISVAAVVGDRWQLKIVEGLVDMPEDELLGALERALQAEVINSDDERAEIYRFSHGLIREVCYAAQHIRRRRRLHEQIAVRLEAGGGLDIYPVAYHYYEAENWEKAVDACLAAGEQAARRFAINSALGWYQQALDAAERLGEELDRSVLFTIYDRLGRTHLALEQRHEAEIVYNRMRDAAKNRADLTAEGEALLNLANVRMRSYQIDLAEKLSYEALQLAEKTGNQRLLSQVHASLGGFFIIRGQLDQAQRHYDQALQNGEAANDSGIVLDMLRMNAYQATWEGRYKEAKHYASQALALAKINADTLATAGAYQNLSFAQVEAGDYQQAYQNISDILDAVEISGSHHHQKPRLLNLMGYLHLELGGAQEALAWDQRALEAVRDTYLQALEMRRYSLLNQATDYLHLGQFEEVLNALAQFEAIRDGVEFAHFRYYNRYQLLLCELYLVQNAFEAEIEMALQARSLASSKGMVKNIAKSLWYEGQALTGMKRYDEAEKRLEESVAMVDEIGHGSLRWKIRLSLAEALSQAGKSTQRTLAQAHALIDQTIQSLSGTPLQEIFTSSDWIKRLEKLEHTPILEKPGHPAGLTQREVEVLKLVARGATNQQVAHELHISIRTVNTHMTNILNKTGCENRTAASAFAIHHNLLST